MSEQNKQVVREYYERVLNGRDLDAVGDFFVDERIVEGVKGGCFRYFEAFPDLHIALDDVIEIARARVTRGFTKEECRTYLHVSTCPAE